MVRRLTKAVLVVALLALAAILALAVPAYAGGWAVVTLDALPENVAAGTPAQIGMVARQHGASAWEVEAIAIQAEHVETGERVKFTALPDGPPGHYQAELLFPAAGRWQWSVSSGLFPAAQPMPDLEVGAAPAAAPGTTVSAAAGMVRPPAAALAVSALAALAAGVGLIVRGRPRQLPLLAGLGLLILCAGLAWASYASANAQARPPVPATGAGEAMKDPAAAGQQLFLAKGCVVCHTNERALQNSAEFGVAMGPNLTYYQNDPAYIHTLLKDPRAVNQAAQMPQLDLKLHEIEALVAFINDHE